jgi:heptosyltransferase-2
MSERVSIARIEGLPCSPCYRRLCPLGHFRCLNELPVQQVLQAIDTMDLG